MPSKQLQALESARDANMKVFFPGPSAQQIWIIYVVPNPIAVQVNLTADVIKTKKVIRVEESGLLICQKNVIFKSTLWQGTL